MTTAKMATEIPAAITMPDSVETRLGTLRFIDGFPDDATVENVLDKGCGDQPRHLCRCLLRADSAVRSGEQLGADMARQGVDGHPSSLRSIAAVLRQDMAAQRD